MTIFTFQDVLKEAENIITDGPLQQATTLDHQNVIVDQIDVEFKFVLFSLQFQYI